MVLQNKEVNYLIHLLACAINEKDFTVQQGIDYSALFSLAKKHQVYNIIYPIISQLEDIPQQEKDNWRDYNYSEITRMIVINNERSVIYNSLNENGIKFMPLKGLILKNYYPRESMRQMSDNDILFDSSKRDTVAKFMKEYGYKTLATGENSDDYFKAPYCTFEFHRNLFFAEHDFCPEFKNLWDNASQDDEMPCMYHMGPEDVYIYSVCHMYKHFSTAGCGIRFLADNYLFLKKESRNLDWNYIDSQFDKYGISDYEKQSRELAFKLFDEQSLDDEDVELLQTYINFGIYGDGRLKLSRNLEKLAQDTSIDNAKRKYLISRLFPSKKKMIADYRILEKKPYILPLLYIYRLFKGVKNGKKTVSEIKAVNNADKQEK